MRRKVAKARQETPPNSRDAKREPEDRVSEPLPSLQRTSRFREHDEADDNGHVYPTARYTTRFD
jgi:hypothetical protein